MRHEAAERFEMKPLIAISMLSADFANLERDLKRAQAAGVDWIHVDVMDGHFVPNITIGPDQVGDLRKTVTIPFDVHLMVSEPLKYIERFAKAGANLITVHVESDDDPAACIKRIEDLGCKPGIVISPDTSVEAVKPYLDDICMILVMSVYPGFGGQSYIEASTDRLKTLKKMIGDRPIRLEVDGGVNFKTLSTVLDAGADTIVSGSCLFGGDVEGNVARFREIMEK